MAEEANIVIDQGANFQMVLDFRNPDNTGVNLTGYTFAMHIKDRPGGAMLANVSGSVSRDTGVAGRININIPAATTSGFGFDQGVYDVLITSGTGVKTRLVQGRVVVSKAVTTS